METYWTGTETVERTRSKVDFGPKNPNRVQEPYFRQIHEEPISRKESPKVERRVVLYPGPSEVIEDRQVVKGKPLYIFSTCTNYIRCTT